MKVPRSIAALNDGIRIVVAIPGRELDCLGAVAEGRHFRQSLVGNVVPELGRTMLVLETQEINALNINIKRNR